MGATSINYAYLIGKETTAGTAVTCDKDIGVITNVSPSLTREAVIARGISSIEQHSNYVGMTDASHSVTLQVQHARMFEFIIGTATHGSSGSDWKHTFTVSSSPSTFTRESGVNISTDIGQRSTYNMIESATLSIALNGLLGLDFTAKGKTPSALATVPAHSVSTLGLFPH